MTEFIHDENFSESEMLAMMHLATGVLISAAVEKISRENLPVHRIIFLLEEISATAFRSAEKQGLTEEQTEALMRAIEKIFNEKNPA